MDIMTEFGARLPKVSWRTVRHSTFGFELPLPDDWKPTEDVPDCALVASGPEPDPGVFVPNLVVTVEPRDPDESFERWVTTSLQNLQQALDHVRVIDVEDTRIEGHQARRVLTHYRHASGGVNLEPWLVSAGEAGYVLSFSTSVGEYDSLYTITRAVAEGLRIGGALG
ncbi:MAG: hypothetical protein ACRDPT_12795 [Streptomycetales bacterium]